MHQTLYLTYRPANFSQVIGQDHIVRALSMAVQKNKVAHAYLFTGPRGTGKTTVGRLLAKAVNCEQSKDGQTICDECNSCQSITAGNNLDIIEIDAASNRGIDDIRALRERVAFPPQELKKKVYIIDEVHMLTTEAFNALLKTLEEPPVHALFILATTEPHKVPVTIQSRCQRLDFHRGTPADLITNLKRVAKQESVDITDDALDLIAELAEGGYRDSLTLLERALSSDGEVTADKIRELFGLGDEQLIHQLISNIIAKNREAVFTILDQAENKGVNPPYLAQMVVYRLRHLLYAKVGATKAEQWEVKVGNSITLMQLRELLEYWMKATIDSRHSPIAILPLEIAAAKWLEKDEIKVEIKQEEVIPEVELSKKPIEIVAEKKEPKIEESTNNTAQEMPAIAIDSKQWEEIVEILVKHNHSISKLLQNAAVGKISNDAIPIYVQYPFHKETLQQKVNYEAIAVALQKVLKQTLVPDIKVEDAPKDALRLIMKSEPASSNMADSVKDVFL